MRGDTFVALMLLSALACGGPNIGRVKPQLQPPASPMDFGELPVLNELLIDAPVLNVGRATLNVLGVSLATDDGIFRIASAPTEVTSGNTENIKVGFTPLKEQDYTNTLVLETDDANSPRVEVVLTGRGSTRAIMELQPASIDFGRVAECGAVVQQLTIISKGTADLIVQELAFTEGTDPGFSFVGSTRTPATVKFLGANGLPGQIQLTVKYAAALGSSGEATGGVRVKGTDPENREVVIPLHASVNRAPVAVIGALGNGAPGQTVTLDGQASTDPDNDLPLTWKWTMRSRPLASTTTIAAPEAALTTMRLDPAVPGAYEVQLDVTDATGVKSCVPARAQVVAAPAQKLLVEMFWDNAATDLDLHVLAGTAVPLGRAPGDCFFQNRAPDWGVPGATDDPLLSRDALTGYGPEIFGYVNPVDMTYRVAVVFANDLLSPTPASKATVRIYEYGVLKAELSRTLQKDDIWAVADVVWPTGEVTALP